MTPIPAVIDSATPVASWRTGLQTEVLLSFALVMGLSTVVLVASFWTHQETVLRSILGPALLAESRAPHPSLGTLFSGTQWWRLDGRGEWKALGGPAQPPPSELVELARRAHAEHAPMLQPGSLGARILFAVPVGARGEVAAAALPSAVSNGLRTIPLAVVASLAIVNLTIFTVFGAWLLRRRVVLPLQDLAAGALRIAEGAEHHRVEVSGPQETQWLANAFNEMTEALEGRTEELEKAVLDLRSTNRELRETREGIDRAERLAAVGTLAAGVAHEVGNPMGALLTFLELAQRQPGLPDDASAHLRKAQAQGERVRRILQQLLNFSRPTQAVCEPFDMAATCEEIAELVRPQPRYCGVALEVSVQDAVPPALGDPSVVHQILLNLLLNAGDALEGADEPRVEMTVRRALARTRAGDEGYAPPAGGRVDAVECVVADNGAGVPGELRDRIFAPFFTTKDPDKGSGLGLATAARQAQEMGGRLDLVAARDEMTTAFVLTLPCAPGENSDARLR